MSEIGKQAIEFESLVRQLFQRRGFDITVNDRLDLGYDFAARGHGLEWLIEVKYYRSEMAHSRLVEAAATRLAAAADSVTAGRPMLVLSSVVPHDLRWRLHERYGIAVQDRYDLVAAALKDGSDALISFLNPSAADAPREQFGGMDEPLPDPEPTSTPLDTEGTRLANELNELKPGRKTWVAYEKLCGRILRYLFRDDLYGWHEQKRTDDGLSSFDLVCRVRTTSDFWRFLAAQVRSQYVLFEFKNYRRKIKQGQILTTEKYLLENGLRRCAVILTREGGDKGAVAMMQGAMRQNGKLILILDDALIVKMLHGKERGDDPSDLLFDMADTFLLSLAR